MVSGRGLRRYTPPGYWQDGRGPGEDTPHLYWYLGEVQGEDIPHLDIGRYIGKVQERIYSTWILIPRRGPGEDIPHLDIGT